MKNTILALVLLGGSALAQAAPAVAPDAVVKGTTEKLQTLIAENHAKYKADLPSFYKVVDDIVVPHFDQRYIAQLVLARNWKAASDEQRQRFQDAFKNMLIRAYANSMLDNYDSVKAEWQPLRMAADATDVTVNSKLLRKQGPPIAVGFLMHVEGGEWRIYDILIENLSLVSNFRAQFAAEIKKSGLDKVIARMESGDNLADGKPGARAK